MVPFSREKVPVQCITCKRINFARRDFLKRKVGSYKCRNCCNKGKKRTLEYRLKSSLIHRKHSLNESFFKRIDAEKKAYWLGFLSGDGAITENKVRLALSLKDKNHLKKFKRTLGWSGKDYYHINTNALEVYFRSSRMVIDLAKFYITPRKTFTVRFPNIPKHLEKHFIRGVFDADGCINKAVRITQGKNGQRYIFYGGEFCIQGNKEFILGVRARLLELGLPPNSIRYPGKSINRVRYGGINQLRVIYKYLYNNSNVFLERKKRLYEDILRNYRSEVIENNELSN